MVCLPNPEVRAGYFIWYAFKWNKSTNGSQDIACNQYVNIQNCFLLRFFFSLTVASGHYPGGGFFLPNATKPEVMGSIRGRAV